MTAPPPNHDGAGYSLPARSGIRAQAESITRIRYDTSVFNAGVIGDTTQKGLSRLRSVEALNPDLVILELGGNDMLNGVDPRLTKANLDEIIVRLRSRGARVLLAGMRASQGSLKEAERPRFDRVFPALAARHSLPFLPSILEGVFGDPKLVLWGGLHPNRDGVRRIVDRIAPLVENTLDELPAKGRADSARS
jgi:acyl-CoA thioesterase I